MGKRYTGGRPKDEDTSPPEIQRMRRAYVDYFMKTGDCHGPLHQQLLAYAESQRPPETTYLRHFQRKPEDD